ncbi:hypothetical protein, partial [Salmonella sp. SAL4434]|uniref:hypothetical protein n=1 Tax=Salmonella sp. SAL4434 TaxID=3159889 RepID=UPI00397C4C2B
MQFVTGFAHESSTNDTELTANGGEVIAHIETRRVAAANASVKAGEIDFVDLVLAQDSIEGNEDLDSTPRLATNDTAVAPPDLTINP